MKRICLTLLLCFLLSLTHAQLLDLDWARTLSSPGVNISNAVTTDAQGNVYTTGYFSDSVDFDPGPGTFFLFGTPIAHAFVQKLDANGGFVWAVSYGGGNNGTRPEAIQVDANGDIYVIGNFLGPLDFDPGPGVFTLNSQGFTDAYLQKLDANGNFLWARGVASNGGFGAISTAIAVDGDGNVFITGRFSSVIDIDPGPGVVNLTSAGAYDQFLQKLDSAGTLVWAQRLGGNNNDFGTGVIVDGAGNVYTTGAFGSTIDFDPGVGMHTMTAGSGGENVFFAKVGPQWEFSLGKIRRECIPGKRLVFGEEQCRKDHSFGRFLRDGGL